MMYFANLSSLDAHVVRIKSILGKDCFLVGGAVRDVLLGMSNTDDPQDIDITLAAAPDAVFSALQQKKDEAVGVFHTQKYGTATILFRKNETTTYSYEITPFREEGAYNDHRHPTDVRWTSSLVQDAGRRDFTINSLYYTCIHTAVQGDDSVHPQGGKELEGVCIDTDMVLVQLEKQGRSYIPGLSLLVVQDHSLIQTLFPEGVYDSNAHQQRADTVRIPYAATPSVRRFLFDPHCGIHDAIDQKIRTVGSPDKRFQEDALRILRALRFVNIRNQKKHGATFDFHKDTRQSMKKQYSLVQYLAKERVHDEIKKVFMADNPFGYVALLDELHLLQYIFPALARCKGNVQPIRYHPFDTYTHILLTLYHLQQMQTSYLVKLGMLYHDVGKPDQYYYYAQCKTKEDIEALHGSWANHTVCGAEFTTRDFDACGFSRKEVEEITRYVAMHMRPGQILDAHPDNQIKKVRLLYSEYGYERVRNLFALCKADRLGQYNPIQSAEIEQVDILQHLLDDLRDAEGQFTKKDLAISGNDIMQECTLPAGPAIGDLLEKTFQRVLHDAVTRNKKETILSYIKGILS